MSLPTWMPRSAWYRSIPDNGLYAVQVRAGRATAQQGSSYQGPWSNPAIAPFGPVQQGTKPDEDKR